MQCDGSCNAPSDPGNAGSKCKTPNGCDGKVDCDGVCQGEPLATGTACTVHGCSGKLACDGSCAGDPLDYGKACTTTAGCPSTVGCDLSCSGVAGAGDACTTATCKLAAKKDCAGLCPDTKPGDVTKTCRTCICTTGTLDVKEDVCGVCKDCAAAGCIPPVDAGPDVARDVAPDVAPDTTSDVTVDSISDTESDTTAMDAPDDLGD